MEIPVYAGPLFCGYVSDDDARDIIRKSEGRLLRKVKRDGRLDRRIVMNPEPGAVSRVRALCNTSTQSALSPTQQEELYSGRRKDGTDTPVYFPPLVVVRKIRTNKHGEHSFQNWGENDRFPRRRFNQDRLPPPLFQSARDYAVSSSA